MGGRGAGFNKKNKSSIITGIADSDLKECIALGRYDYTRETS